MFFGIAEVSRDYLGQMIEKLIKNARGLKEGEWLINRLQQNLDESTKKQSELEAELVQTKARLRCIQRVLKHKL